MVVKINKLFLLAILLVFSMSFICAVTNVIECGVLNSENTVYTLNQSIGSGSNGDCIIINATNITLDCQGYNITYGNATAGWGIAVVDEDLQFGFDNATIRNCIIIQNDTGINDSAIFFGENSTNGAAYNNTITVYGLESVGIFFEGDSVSANISLNNITTSGINGTGIFLGEAGSDADIRNNIVVTSANDSSGILMGEDSTNGTLFNNTITTSGNLSTMDVMGGIFLEIGTSGMNVSSNNITTSGTDGAGIWIWGSNSTIDSNTIIASGEAGDGIYLDDSPGVNLTSNTITISGISADGIHSQMSENYTLVFYNNFITTSANYSDGIHLYSDSYNNISSNNITTSGNFSYGIYFNESHHAILTSNIIKTGESNSYVLDFVTSSNNTFYNNIFNTSTSGSGVNWTNSDVSYFNTTNTTTTNIVGKTYIGGNFWTNTQATGYSDSCINLGDDYFCDSSYVLGGGTDYLPLTIEVRWGLNGTVYDIDGNALYNATINVTIRNSTFGVVEYDSTYSNETGWFNLAVSGNSSWMYQPVVTHFTDNKTDGSTAIDYIGQSLPAFPYQEFSSGMNVNFYLREAGTINITAMNDTGSSKNFQYQIKDTLLGYPIAESWSYVSQAIVYIPRNRNYSIMIYPNESLPISFDWDNFSSANNYSFNYDSNYNATTHTLVKRFNCSETLEWVDGYINVTGISGWDEFTIVPFILEPGDMIYLGDNSAMPYNMSAWRRNATGAQLWADDYNLFTGFYNVTLPAPAESATYMLFATARNNTGYYGQYLNVSLSYGESLPQTNFTHMSGLMNYTGWADAKGNITMKNSVDWSDINISSTRQGFNLVNSTDNSTLSQLSAHIEVIVDYSNYGSREFTFMLDTSQQGDSTFYLPLINATGIKEMNIYSMNYAPKRVGTMTAAQITANPNITMAMFNPGDIDGTNLSSSIYISLYKSNSTCDVLNPPSSCSLTDSSNMDNFKPLSAVMSGGKISFRMGLTTTGIEIHYVNVDMLASGPPDALFDDSTNESTSAGFESALRFGSSGPTIYDYVLISLPYTEGNTSQTGLSETGQVNMSIPLFYDDDWDVIWNTTANGTNGTDLAGNDTHYNTYSTEWETLMGNNTCNVTTTGTDTISADYPCHIDTTNNRIWIRLPHFSGTGPSITGSVVTATSSTDDDDDSTGGSTTALSWTITHAIGDEQFKAGYTKELGIKNRLRVSIDNEYHYIGVVELTSTTAVINVSSTPQQATLSIGDTRRFDVNDDSYYDIKVTLNSISDNKASITILSISEEVTAETEAEEEGKEAAAKGEEGVEEEKKNTGLIILIIILILAAAVGSGMAVKKKRKQ